MVKKSMSNIKVATPMTKAEVKRVEKERYVAHLMELHPNWSINQIQDSLKGTPHSLRRERIIGVMEKRRDNIIKAFTESKVITPQTRKELISNIKRYHKLGRHEDNMRLYKKFFGRSRNPPRDTNLIY